MPRTTEPSAYDLGFGSFDDCDGDVIPTAADQRARVAVRRIPLRSGERADRPRRRTTQIRSISSLTIVNGGDRSKRLYGDITLRARTNSTSRPRRAKAVITLGGIAGEG